MGTTILVISILMQLAAAGLAFRLVWVTPQRVAWMLISLSISLMAIRRIASLIFALSGERQISTTTEFIAMIISLLMLVGVFQMKAVFSEAAASETVRELNKQLSEELVRHTHTEERLRESEERFRLAVQGSSDGLWEWIPGTNDVWYANRFRELLGYNPDEFPGTLESFNSHLHADDHKETWEAVELHLAEGEPFDVEFRLRTKTGEYRWFRSRGIAARDEEGNATRMAGAIRDIHRRKEYEQKLEQTAAELQRSNKELTHFAYIASHDLEEPLRAVAGFTALLKDDYGDKLDEQGVELIDHAISGARRMQRMIRDLLEYSRVGQANMDVAKVELNTVVAQALDNLQTLIAENNAELSIADLPTVMGSEVQLVRMIQNLIGNAIKFHGEETPQVRVSVEEHESEFIITIADNGIGIPEAHREDVFRIFTRLHSRATYEGTGIGLAVCRRIIEGHQGRIWVADSSPQGTTIRFTLPQMTATELDQDG